MKIRQYDVKRGAAKISALQSGKIDQYEYLTGEEIVLFNQSRIAEQAKVTYCPLWKSLRETGKNNWRSVWKTKKGNRRACKKQTEAWNILDSNDQKPRNKDFIELDK